MFDINSFFPNIKEFDHKNLIEGADTPWYPLTHLKSYLENFLKNLPKNIRCVESLKEIRFIPQNQNFRFKEPGFIVEEWFQTDSPIYIKNAKVLLGAGIFLEPTAIIKGPAIIGDQSEIRQGAFLRTNVIAGNHCVLGHTTEIKNTIIMNHTEAGHFNYLGDSIIGSYVNMGAGSKIANLKFRKSEDKIKVNFPDLKIKWEDKITPPGMAKLGAVIGDHCELGCNSVLAPGTFLGKESWVYPNCTAAKGNYSPGTKIKPK